MVFVVTTMPAYPVQYITVRCHCFQFLTIAASLEKNVSDIYHIIILHDIVS